MAREGLERHHGTRQPSPDGKRRLWAEPYAEIKPESAPPRDQAGAVSERMSMRQPVSRAASRAFWPSRPMASDS